jgi:hypothetical protein
MHLLFLSPQLCCVVLFHCPHWHGVRHCVQLPLPPLLLLLLLLLSALQY